MWKKLWFFKASRHYFFYPYLKQKLDKEKLWKKLIFGLKKWPFLLPRKTSLFLSRTSIIIVWTGYFVDLLQLDLTESDERLFSKSRYFASCDLLVTSFELLVATILDRIKWNSKLPSPQIKDEAAQKPKRPIFSSSILEGGGGRVQIFHLCCPKL